MKMAGKLWLSVDTDDYEFLPSVQGHKTRSPGSTIDLENYEPSEDLIRGFAGLNNWMKSNDYPLTIFVIAGQLINHQFRESLQEIIDSFPDRITIGNHGYNHRSWSSFLPDKEGFSQMLEESDKMLLEFGQERFKKWFRAPSGYIDEWMVESLSKSGYIVDSSVNPSFLMNYKYGKSNFKSILKKFQDFGIVERKWKTRLGLPICGPALFKFPLRWNAKMGWKNSSDVIKKDELQSIVEGSEQIETIYWHILDFARDSGTWLPQIGE